MAVTWSAASNLAACDNLGKTMIDAFGVLPSSVSALVTDLQTEITRIQALSDQLVAPTMGSAWNIESQTAAIGDIPAGRMIAWLNALNYNQLVNSYGLWNACDALDFIASQISTYTGEQQFLAAQTAPSSLVDVYTADCFNGWANAVKSGAYLRRYGTTIPPTPIASTQVFPHSNVDTINTFTLTSTSAGTLAAGTASLAALTGGIVVPGGGTLEAYAGNTIGAASYTITATYTNIFGTTGQTLTFSVASGATSGTVFTPSATVYCASIQSVAITVGSGTSGDLIKFRLKPVRTITA